MFLNSTSGSFEYRIIDYFMLFYVIAKVDNYFKNRIDPISIIINGD